MRGSGNRRSRRRLPAYAALLLAGALLGNCSAFRREAARTSAKSALRSGDYARARQGFESALKASPASRDDQYGLLEVLLQTGAYREAAKKADSFLAAGESAAVRLQRGRAAAAVGDYAVA